MTACPCANEYQVDLLGPGDYIRFKRVLDRGRHPTMIGHDMYERNAHNGGATVYVYDDQDAAASLVNPRLSCLLVLNVAPPHRDHGLGGSILRHQATNWARVLDTAVPYFQRHGYEPIGAPKQGRRHLTQVMVRQGLRELAGRIHKHRPDACTCLLEPDRDAHRRGDDVGSQIGGPGDDLHAHDPPPRHASATQKHDFPPPNVHVQQRPAPPRRQRPILRHLRPRNDLVHEPALEQEQHEASMGDTRFEARAQPLNTNSWGDASSP